MRGAVVGFFCARLREMSLKLDERLKDYSTTARNRTRNNIIANDVLGSITNDSGHRSTAANTLEAERCSHEKAPRATHDAPWIVSVEPVLPVRRRPGGR